MKPEARLRLSAWYAGEPITVPLNWYLRPIPAGWI
jgi:hypothetical protein